MDLRVHLAPSLYPTAELPGRIAIVVDVLRASTTIIAALNAGAARVIPCEEIVEARSVYAHFRPGEALLAGERGGLRPGEFDLGNSPQHFTRERLAGPPAKAVVLTTSNGTRAVRCAKSAASLLVGAFTNLDAVAAHAIRLAEQSIANSRSASVSILCAGTLGQPCLDDIVCAGALADRIAATTGTTISDDSARLAACAWAAASTHLLESLLESSGGRQLVAIDHADDIRACAAVNTTGVVPVRIASGDLVSAMPDAP